MIGIAGLVFFIVLAWSISSARTRVPWRVVSIAVVLQFVLAALFVLVPGASGIFSYLNDGVIALQRATDAGTGFVFGYLGGAPAPFEVKENSSSFILAFRALPLILVLSAISSLLVYWRVLPVIVGVIGKLLERSLSLGPAAALGAAANIFVGMVEAPLFIRPYLEKLSRSDLFLLMATGMATIAGTVLVLYATILGTLIDDAIAHLLVASIISVPAAVMFALIIEPPDGTSREKIYVPPPGAANAIDAIVSGGNAGLKLCLNVVTLLIVLVALVHLTNTMLGFFLPDAGGQALTLQRVFGWLFAPLAYLMGIPWNEALPAGTLLGEKLVLNELIAYSSLVAMPAETFSPRTQLILTYALCGFANIGSLGIMIAGLTTMAPDRRDAIISLGLKAVLAGTLATFTTGTVVGLLSVVVDSTP